MYVSTQRHAMQENDMHLSDRDGANGHHLLFSASLTETQN
jgi:hypothetical protein